MKTMKQNSEKNQIFQHYILKKVYWNENNEPKFWKKLNISTDFENEIKNKPWKPPQNVWFSLKYHQIYQGDCGFNRIFSQ